MRSSRSEDAGSEETSAKRQMDGSKQSEKGERMGDRIDFSGRRGART